MCACLLLDPFQLYLVMSIVFGLSLYIYTATANSCAVGNKNVLVGFFGGRWGGGDSNNKIVLRVIPEKMKICTYLHVRNNPYPEDMS